MQLQSTKRRRFLSRELVIGLVVAIALGCLGFVIGSPLVGNTNNFRNQAMVRDRPLTAKDVWITTRDGVRLHGWFFKRKMLDLTQQSSSFTEMEETFRMSRGLENACTTTASMFCWSTTADMEKQ